MIVLIFFAVIGVCGVCRGIARGLSKPLSDREIILIEPIKCGQENAEYLLRRAAQKVLWMGRHAPDRVIALDCDMDAQTRKLCSLVCGDYPFMELCTKAELQERIIGL
ncbi:MAG: hypothetical protein IJ725_03465 [Ruminococcus sp.]|nr:hypothetical protein [Ruminococcus sp.]